MKCTHTHTYYFKRIGDKVQVTAEKKEQNVRKKKNQMKHKDDGDDDDQNNLMHRNISTRAASVGFSSYF